MIIILYLCTPPVSQMVYGLTHRFDGWESLDILCSWRSVVKKIDAQYSYRKDSSYRNRWGNF